MSDVEVRQVIVTRLERRGKGTESDPYRRIEQWWSMNGMLIFEFDPYLPAPPKEEAL